LAPKGNQPLKIFESFSDVDVSSDDKNTPIDQLLNQLSNEITKGWDQLGDVVELVE
jgi:hypothetical protein